jgi:hypothetical protein
VTSTARIARKTWRRPRTSRTTATRSSESSSALIGGVRGGSKRPPSRSPATFTPYPKRQVSVTGPVDWSTCYESLGGLVRLDWSANAAGVSMPRAECHHASCRQLSAMGGAIWVLGHATRCTLERKVSSASRPPHRGHTAHGRGDELAREPTSPEPGRRPGPARHRHFVLAWWGNPHHAKLIGDD